MNNKTLIKLPVFAKAEPKMQQQEMENGEDGAMELAAMTAAARTPSTVSASLATNEYFPGREQDASPPARSAQQLQIAAVLAPDAAAAPVAGAAHEIAINVPPVDQARRPPPGLPAPTRLGWLSAQVVGGVGGFGVGAVAGSGLLNGLSNIDIMSSTGLSALNDPTRAANALALVLASGLGSAGGVLLSRAMYAIYAPPAHAFGLGAVVRPAGAQLQ